MRTTAIIFLSTIILVMVSACANNHVEKATMAIGEVNQAKLFATHKSFKQSYQAFKVSDSDLVTINNLPSNLHIDVYFGAWCHDSQREVPRFLKLVAENKTLSTRLIALDYEKSEPNGSAKSHAIKYTPTFVVYQNDKEIGRIVERPKVSIAADISAML